MDTKKIAQELARKYDTNDPFALADFLEIVVQVAPLGEISGCCLKIAGQKFIYINADLPRNTRRLVAAHELGHAVLHEENFFFYSRLDNVYICRAEREAHSFAVELLVPDEVVLENPGYTVEQLARLTGYTEKLLRFKRL